MTDVKRKPMASVQRILASADAREYLLFLGAGASKSSGIPLAGEMIAEWRDMMLADHADGVTDREAWLREQDWYEQPDEYSRLFEQCFPTQRARQKYVEPKIEQGIPGWGYLYLANLIQNGFFNVVFTTNFDDLVNEALSTYLSYNPVVCAADSAVATININTARAKIIKLHGDYLFKDLKNTVQELETLYANMASKFSEFCKQAGMVVVGYAGRDESVMRVIRESLEDPYAYPAGIWWGLHGNESPSPEVAALAIQYPRRFHCFECSGFDDFMVELHAQRDLSLPVSVMQPYVSVAERFDHLIHEVENDPHADHPMISDASALLRELGRPWAQNEDAASFDLLEARLALSRRDHEQALKLVAHYLETHDEEATVLTLWGDTLALASEQQLDPVSGERAVEKWQAAIALEPTNLPALYSLTRFHQRSHNAEPAIVSAEKIAALVPDDSAIRRDLIYLYGSSGRSEDAIALIDEMLAKEPDAADLYGMKCSALEQRGLVAKALEAIQRAVELDPQRAFFRFGLANGLARMNRSREAEVEYLEAIRIDPNNLGFRLQCASFYSTTQHIDKAIDQLEHAVKIEPNSAEAQGYLGQSLMAANRLEEAIAPTRAALTLSPHDGRIHINMASINMRLGNMMEAEAGFRKAIELNPQQPQGFYWLSVVLWVAGNDSAVQANISIMRQTFPEAAGHVQQMLEHMSMQAMGMANRRLEVLQQWFAHQQPQPLEVEPELVSVTSQIKRAFGKWLSD
ncbi:MAG: tetratricopeptide repeat protein [Woeseiaceae bacterium]